MPDRPSSPLRRFQDVRVGLCLRTALRGTGNPGPNANNEVNQTHVAEAKPSLGLRAFWRDFCPCCLGLGQLFGSWRKRHVNNQGRSVLLAAS
jgi:hypothetical protein